MNVSLILACFWGIAANVIAMMPSRDSHWSNAYVLISIGVPILLYVGWENGPWVALLVLAAGASVLRWPVIYLTRWLRKVAHL